MKQNILLADIYQFKLNVFIQSLHYESELLLNLQMKFDKLSPLNKIHKIWSLLLKNGSISTAEPAKEEDLAYFVRQEKMLCVSSMPLKTQTFTKKDKIFFQRATRLLVFFASIAGKSKLQKQMQLVKKLLFVLQAPETSQVIVVYFQNLLTKLLLRLLKMLKFVLSEKSRSIS